MSTATRRPPASTDAAPTSDELAGLLAQLAAADIRLTADGGRLGYDAPEGAMTVDLKRAILTHKAALLALLGETPAARAARVRSGLPDGSCLGCNQGPAHHRAWRYVPGLGGMGRYLCRICEPDTYAARFPAQLAGDVAQGERQEAQESQESKRGAQEGEERARRRVWVTTTRRDLYTWGEAHDWPRLAIAHSANEHTRHAAPCAWIVPGANGWRAFLAGANGRELAAAYRAAGLAALAGSPEPGETREELAAAVVPEASASASASPATRRGRGAGEVLAALDLSGLWIARPGDAGDTGDTAGEEWAPLTDAVPAPSPAIHAGELLALAARHGITRLWVHASWALAAGLPDRLRGVKPSEGLAHPFTDGAIAAGWDVRPAGLAPWLHCFQRGTYGAIALALPHLEERAPSWREARDGRELLGAVLAYGEALGGYAYRRSPGATGTGLLRSLHSGNRVALDLSASAAPQDFPAPARAGHAAPDLIWARPLTDEERERCTFVHAFDKNAMYLGASASLPLGLGLPEHCAAGGEEGEGLVFDKRLAGYWLARIAYTPPAGLPNPFAAPMHRTDGTGAGWYLSPMIELAYQQGAQVTLQEAYVWRSSPRLMVPWYERMRDARAGLLDRAASGSDPAAALALAAIKRTYTQTFGWLNGGWLRTSETPEDLYRPDWRDSVMAQAAANLYRELLRIERETGRTPFALDTDCAYFASASADTAADCPAPLLLGTGLRHVKVKVSGAPLASVAALLDRLCGAGASANRIIDELQEALAVTPAASATRGEEA